MKFQLTMLACALAVSGCAGNAARERLGIEDATILKSGWGAAQDASAGAPTREWFDIYGPMGNRSKALDNLQQRLDSLPDDPDSYFRAKAQCWADVAREELKTGDRWGFVEEAIGQAAVLTAGLTQRSELSAANPPLRTVSMVRPDLWAVVNAIKSNPALPNCPKAQRPLACAEVGLMRAGYYAWKRNFSAAEQRLPEVQQALQQSAEIALQCTPPAPAIPAKMTLKADSLFGFDRSDEGGMLPAGKADLDALVQALREQGGKVRGMRINGYADRLGRVTYNQKLSLQRAETVQSYLRRHGVTVPMTAAGLGAEHPLVECQQKERSALIQCLAPNRRVEIEFDR
ncbi:OmpA family protein [Paraburkholderia bonniea]|uniref:OmpA family protein n=1 Tax=Paraburkholderia bonniea TaxID=2152891 RepID=UPI001290F4B7|nr:OmpA family protein [Paraburkholderia bonniea]WJF91772.1 OmpA family protein [Paraburkholderia bonniea]WJF95092.1 OmpA family protein [Paraburkholderia bonniea]